MNVGKRFDLIARNTEEILTPQDLREKLKESPRLSAYYGTAPTGRFHVGYLIPLAKLFDFAKAGVTNTVLIADIHAALDDLKTPWEKIETVGQYYQKCIELSFSWDTKPTFVLGNHLQLAGNYHLDVLKLSTLTTVSRAMRAASEVTRMKNPKVSELLYPLMQALDEQYLNADIQLGGIDQRHIFAFAREYLPLLGYRRRVEIMTPLILSLKGPGAKMSASLPESRILVHDSEDALKKVVEKAYCPAGVVRGNPLLQLTRFLVFSITPHFSIERSTHFGGDVRYDSYQHLEQDFADKKLHPSDLKHALAREFFAAFKRVRTYFERHPDLLPP